MFTEFFQPSAIISHPLSGSYNVLLMGLSYLIVVCASYVALDITGHLRTSDEGSQNAKFLWICGSAFALSAGIWSIQFMGMLAYIAPTSIHYDFSLTIAGMLATALLSGLALSLFKFHRWFYLRLVIAGILLGLAIFIMHYISIITLQHDSVKIYHRPGLFVSSIIIAILACIIALWLATNTYYAKTNKQLYLKLLSALFMGAAICGTHYIGLAALIFVPTNLTVTLQDNLFNWHFLSSYTTIISILTIGIALVSLTYKQAASNLLQQKNRQLELTKTALYNANIHLKQLLNQATHDALTELPNRILLLDRLQQMIAQAKRTNHFIAVLFLDLDGFKNINDRLGHPIGDAVLKIIAERLRANIRESDTVARLGGDEFIILFSNLIQFEQVIALAEKISGKLAEPMMVADYPVVITASIGISFYPRDSIEPDELLKFADKAMYRAKESGRNNIQFFEGSY